jgi:hypothetical protein
LAKVYPLKWKFESLICIGCPFYAECKYQRTFAANKDSWILDFSKARSHEELH